MLLDHPIATHRGSPLAVAAFCSAAMRSAPILSSSDRRGGL